MIEGLLTPPNVRSNSSYWEEMDFTKAEEWYEDEIGDIDNAVLMGVPGNEVHNYTNFVSEVLEKEGLEDIDVYAHEEEGEGLEGFDYEEITYDEEPSRVADINWVNENIPEDENVAVFSIDYNVRTGSEMDKRLDNHDTFGQFALDFEDFNDFTLKNYLKGKLPFGSSFSKEVEDRNKNFNYSVPEVENSAAMVVNVPWSENMEDYESKLRTEAFRDGLTRLPYGQKMKDVGKRVVNWFR